MRINFIVIFYLGLQFVSFSDSAQTKSVDVTTIIQNHFAETVLSMEKFNNLPTSQEIKFQVMLPTEAFITHFEMVINQTTYEGVIKEKEKAKKLFTEAKKRGKTTGLVETRKKTDKIFKTSANIGPGVTVQFRLVYQQLLRKLRGKFTNKIILFGDQFSEYLTMNVYICESKKVTNVTVPPMLAADGSQVTPNVDINIFGKTARVELLNDNQGLMTSFSSNGGAFIVEYELEPSGRSAEVVVNNGYFLFFGPEIEAQPRRIMFLLDVSGSMSGHKIEQVRLAMKNVLRKMNPLDRISLLKFSDVNDLWVNELRAATPKVIQEAVAFIDKYDRSGGTEIWKALKLAFEVVNLDVEKNTKVDPATNFIVLLTDGQGSLGTEDFLNRARHGNKARFGIHTISFGRGANNNLLRNLAAQHNGTWRQILVDLNSALQIENFVDELSINAGGTPFKINYPDIVDVALELDINYGGEVTSVGKFKEFDDIEALDGPHTISVQGFSLNDEVLQSSFNLAHESSNQCGGMGINDIENFAAKAFGMSKVEDVLEQMANAKDPTEKENLKQKAVTMSLQYKLVTPVTSILVIKPEDEKAIKEDLEKAKEKEESEETEELDNRPVPASRMRHGPKMSFAPPAASMHSDPHVIVKLSKDITACFTWVGREEENINLFYDVENSIVINGRVQGDKTRIPGKGHVVKKRLFITQLVMLLKEEHIQIEIDPDSLTVKSYPESMDEDVRLLLPLRHAEKYTERLEGLQFDIAEVKRHHVILNITIQNRISFVVEVHHRYDENEKSRDHLDLALPKGGEASHHTGGILGRLRSSVFLGDGKARIVENEAKNVTYLYLNNDRMQVTRHKMRVPYLKYKIDCWLVRGHFEHLLGVKLKAFKLGSLKDTPELD